jgi:hypothetical protein
MASRSADAAWLRRFARRVTALLDARNPPGLQTFPASGFQLGGSETGGWWLELGRLVHHRSVMLELWLDRYAAEGSRRLWYGVGAASDAPIRRIVAALPEELGEPLRITDRHLEDSASIARLSQPLDREQFDRPIFSTHDVSGYGVYEWHAPPFSAKLERDRAEHIARFFCLIAEAGGTSGSRPTSQQGRQDDFAVRKAIENESVRRAESYYVRKGYEVERVGSTQSYDLRCRRGAETRFVEVKGTMSSGSLITLTRNEVELARDPSLALDLFVVHSLEVAGSPGRPLVRGGTAYRYESWHPKNTDLEPATFTCRLDERQGKRVRNTISLS